jgi:aspartate racemase
MKILNLPALTVLAAALVVGCGAREQPADRTTDATSKSAKAPPAHKGAETNMKTIGVLGGLGPQATMDFEARIHRVAQRLITPSYNRGYPPMVVYYCRHAPGLLTEQDKPQLPPRPDPRLLEAAKRLGGLADFLVIPSNTPHLFQAEIEQAAGRKVLSMIDVTLEEVRRRKWKRVGVLGFARDPVFYTRPLGQLGIACETLGPESRASLDKAIGRLMEGRDDAESAAAAREAVAALRARGVDGVILGCTEIPLLLRESADEADLINPAQLLAEATVRAAVK